MLCVFLIFFLIIFSVSFALGVIDLKSECIDNSCTLYEGETIIYNDHTYSLSFISSSSVRLIVDGTDTDVLSEGQSQTINDITITIQNIISEGGYIVEFTVSDSSLKSSCTDNLCTLYEGETIGYNEHVFSISFISSTEVKLNVDGTDTNTLSEGQSQTIGNIEVTIKDIFLSIEEGYIVQFIVDDISLKSKCIDNECKLYEGEIITHNGHDFSISFISSTTVKLNVDGTDTNTLSELELYVIGDITINIKNIDFNNGFVEFFFTIKDFRSSCTDNSCTLYEGETIIYNDHKYSLSFISSSSVRLIVDGTDTDLLSVGESQIIGNVEVTIKGIIIVDDFVNGISFYVVEFTVGIIVVEIPKDDEDYVCQGCALDDKCYPFGYRKSGDFCSDSFKFVAQSEAGDVCENNFECESNVCVSGECISKSFIQKILDFFRRLFGGE